MGLRVYRDTIEHRELEDIDERNVRAVALDADVALEMPRAS